MLIGPVAVRTNRVAPPRGPQVSMNTCQRRLSQLTHHDKNQETEAPFASADYGHAERRFAPTSGQGYYASLADLRCC